MFDESRLLGKRSDKLKKRLRRDFQPSLDKSARDLSDFDGSLVAAFREFAFEYWEPPTKYADGTHPDELFWDQLFVSPDEPPLWHPDSAVAPIIQFLRRRSLNSRVKHAIILGFRFDAAIRSFAPVTANRLQELRSGRFRHIAIDENQLLVEFDTWRDGCLESLRNCGVEKVMCSQVAFDGTGARLIRATFKQFTDLLRATELTEEAIAARRERLESKDFQSRVKLVEDVLRKRPNPSRKQIQSELRKQHNGMRHQILTEVLDHLRDCGKYSVPPRRRRKNSDTK